MDLVFFLLPLSLLLACGAVAAFVWATRSGQFDDLETPAHRVLLDDDSPPGMRENSPEEATFKGD